MKDKAIFDRIIDKLNKRLSKYGIEFFNPTIDDFITKNRNSNKINAYISDGQIKLRYQNIIQGESDVITQ